MKRKFTFCFDIDNTICKTLGSNYKNSKPKKKVINKINKLYDNGHIIKIYSARYMFFYNLVYLLCKYYLCFYPYILLNKF